MGANAMPNKQPNFIEIFLAGLLGMFLAIILLGGLGELFDYVAGIVGGLI